MLSKCEWVNVACNVKVLHLKAKWEGELGEEIPEGIWYDMWKTHQNTTQYLKCMEVNLCYRILKEKSDCISSTEYLCIEIMYLNVFQH